MADPGRRTDYYLIQHMQENIFRYDFFHAVRLLELLFPYKTPVGYDSIPEEEVVRFSPVTSMGFPPSSLLSIHFPKKTKPVLTSVLLQTAFLSLYGRHGSLPWHYTHQIIAEEKLWKKRSKGKHNSALRSFIDIFNHRLISLFYRASIKYRLPIQFYHHGASQGVHGYLRSFVGLGTRHLKDKLPVPDIALARYAGFFNQPRCAEALRCMLSDFFKVPIRIEQFVPEWLDIDHEARNRIGKRGVNCQIGTNFMLGKQIWSRQHKFRLIIGPVGFNVFCDFLPDTDACKQMIAITRLYVGTALTFDIKIEINDENIPGMKLGTPDLCLGRTTWLLLKKRKKALRRQHSICVNA